MTKYVKQVASLFSNLEIQQVESYAMKMTIEQVKIVKAEILPQITDMERRKQLKKFFAEREKAISAIRAPESAIHSALQKNVRVSDQLKVMYDDLTQNMVSALNNEAARKLLLERASYNELFVLKQRLGAMVHSDTVGALQIGVYAEMEKRQKDPDKDPIKWMNELRERHKNQNNIRWEGQIWDNLIKHHNEINKERKPHRIPPGLYSEFSCYDRNDSEYLRN